MRCAALCQTLALAVSLVACGSNSPATSGGSGGAMGSGGAPVVTSTGGATTLAQDGSPATTATGAGGSAPAANTAAGGATSSTGTGEFSPSCTGLKTAAGPDPTKGGACTAADAQVCYKTCGPESKGFKSETCTAGSYAEQSGCSFSTGDYSCYKIPTTPDATCPTAVIQASTACTIAACIVCGGSTGYLDSSGAAKTGYCVCQHDTSGNPTKWSCASATAWPCPSGSGC